MGSAEGGRRFHRRLAIVLLAAAGAYVWFVTVQYGRLNDLNQRQLAHAAAELKRSLENAVETVSRFKPSETDKSPLCTFDWDQPYLTLASSLDCHRPLAGKLQQIEISAGAPLAISALVPLSRETLTFQFRADLILRELSFPDSFGLIFIARDDGKVLYQESPSRRRWLRHLRWGEQQFRDSGADHYGSLTLDQLSDVFEGSADAWKRLRAMSGRSTLSLGGQYHEMYFEPLVLENGEKLNLVLGAAAPTESLVRQALAVDSYFLAAAVFVLLLALLGFPFVKLLSLDEHERFRLFDVTLLYLSTAALLALFTFAIQAVDGYIRWHNAAGSGLVQLAYRLEHDFMTEVGRIRGEIDGYDRTLHEQTTTAALSKRPPDANWYGSVGEDQNQPLLPLPTAPVHIEQVSWIGPDGIQIWKTTADGIANKNNVSSRVYFQSVRDGHLYESDDAIGAYYLGPDRSITDGKFYTFVSMPSRFGRGDDGDIVVAASIRLLSLRAPALPGGYGFALVNRTGRVLYHSDGRLSLRENLFDEMTEGVRARAMVYANHEEALTSAYRERPHEFYFRPLPLRVAADHTPAGHYLVTFRDTSLERAIVGRVFLISLLGPMLVLIGFISVSIAAIALVPLGRHEHWSAWLWPHGGLLHTYKRISTVLMIVLAASVAARVLGSSELVFAALPVLALAITVAIYASSTSRRPTRRRLESKGWHSATFVLFLLCTIVVPASALFRAALAHEFGKVIATEQEWMAAQRADLPTLLEAELRAEKRPGSMGRMIARSKANLLTVDVNNRLTLPPHPFDATPPLMAESTHWLLKPFHWADHLLPIENDYAARERFEERDYSYAPRTDSWSPLQVSWWGLAGFAATIGLLTWWIRWKAVRLFFSDHEGATLPSDAPDRLWQDCSDEERLVLVRVAHDHIANPYQHPIVEALLQKGLLKLDPGLQPSSPALAQYIHERERDLADELRRWEIVESGHSWRFTRMVLLASVAGLGLFLLATQPGLQSGLLGIASGIAGALTALMKLQDAVTDWFKTRPKGA